MMLIGRILKTMFVIVSVICIMFTALIVGINVKYYDEIQKGAQECAESVTEVVMVPEVKSEFTEL